MNYLQTEQVGEVLYIRLNRPEKRNALHPELIEAISTQLSAISIDENIRIVVLEGKGDLFCAGADISWLKKLKEASEETRIRDFGKLGELLQTLHSLPQVSIAKVHGGVYGGGLGLMAACDFIYAEENTRFSFSEINVGMVPATISPFIAERVAKAELKRLFMSGKSFSASYGKEIGLIDIQDTAEEIETRLKAFVNLLLSKPGNALQQVKALFTKLESKELTTKNTLSAAKMIAEILSKKETQELFDKFLLKNR